MSNQAVNREFNQYGPLIPWARDQRTGAAIILRNITKTERANIPDHLEIEEYDEKKHKGHLHCYDCEARITVVKEVPSKAGGNLGSIPQHYTTIPNSPHWTSCATNLRREMHADEPDKIDKTKGFRVHINSFGGNVVDALNNEFGPAASNGPYGQSRFKARLKGRDAEALREMETFSVSEAKDFVDFLSHKELSRIKQSRIIHRNYNIPFSDFMLSYDPDLESGRHKKFERFLKGANGNGYRRQPVLMEIITDRPFAGKALKFGTPIESRPIVIEPENGKDKTIIIRPLLLSRAYALDWTFWQPGKFLAIGIATSERSECEDTIEYKISMRLHDAAQVTRADLGEIRAQNEKSQQLREKRRSAVSHGPSSP